MVKQMMIYERAVPVSAEKHRDVSVRQGSSYGFAREVNSVPVLAAEFGRCAMEYAIVFAGTDEVVFPSVILGLGGNRNAMVDAEGGWTGRYVPAFLRRYPFVFAAADDGSRFALCIDEEFEGVNRDGVGERLFDADGNRTRYLEDVVKFTADYQSQFKRTERFCTRLRELDLLEPATAQVTVQGGARTQLGGFQTVNREKLRKLPDAALLEMVRNDELELCYLHLHSLTNLAALGRKAEATEAA